MPFKLAHLLVTTINYKYMSKPFMNFALIM